MSDFLLEVGVEEMPAHSIPPALAALQRGLEEHLAAAGIPFEETRGGATPRRLVVLVAGLALRGADREEELAGPPERVAFADGKPTKAAEGFARSAGVSVSELQVRETPKGRYCHATRRIPGAAAAPVLAEGLPRLIDAIPFPRSMRWVCPGPTFTRPVRWILSLLDDETVPFCFADVIASNSSRGHPFLAPGPFVVERADLDAFENQLLARRVVLDPEKRLARIRQQLAGQGLSEVPERLLEEVNYMVEFPSVLAGTFDESFLDVPAPVLREAMTSHQRYFPVPDGHGLAPRFLTVADRDEAHLDLVRRGNERVLRARLADARFFWETDLETRLADRVGALDGVGHLAGLGTVGERTKRLVELVRFLERPLGLGTVAAAHARRAALLAKADLLTDMVREFPALQGYMGFEYARADGEPDAVALAIRDHYLPRHAGDQLPASLEGIALALADRLDYLAGVFLIGQIPTGSSDPYKLRRTALGLIRILRACGAPVELDQAFAEAVALHGDMPGASEASSQLAGFLRERLAGVLRDEGAAAGLAEAALATRYSPIADLVRRVEALRALSSCDFWSDLVTTVARSYRIYRKEEVRGKLQPQVLVETEERSVAQALAEGGPAFCKLAEAGDYEAASRLYHETFSAKVHVFFEKVFVNVEDQKLRTNRLRLMRDVHELYARRVADLSRIEI